MKQSINKLTRNKWFRRFAKWGFILLATLSLFEVVYRYQWVDFYKSELTGLNPNIDQAKPNVLVFGDSFSAQRGSYVHHLRDSLTQYNIVNCAIPGTAARQAAYVCKSRINEFAPVKVIYQIYLGNDLLDESPPINWSELSFTRNCFWSLSKRFRGIGYLNYKFGQTSTTLNSDFDESFQSKNMEGFAVNKYAPRCKMLLEANASYLNQTYHLQDELRSAYQSNLAYIKIIQASLPDSVDFHVLVIPHPISVNEKYWENFQELGAVFKPANTYPILTDLNEHFSGVLDASPCLMEAEKSNIVVYFNNDDHLNLEGHRIMAKWILDQIEW
ncbi:MAG: hypothetical protein JKY54_07815 [Flavobacteriales bacterium]|nr:hypothetical protein [Flavobacteriales bacterium]